MLKIGVNKLFLLVLFLLPVGVTGIGLAERDAISNISVADFLFIPLVVSLLLSKKRLFQTTLEKKLKSDLLKYVLFFIFIVMLSFINLIRFDNSNAYTAFLSLFKLIVCVSYSYVFLMYLSTCSQKQWERFLTVAVLSAFVFSLSCIAGAILFFRGYPSIFIDYYVTSFRATGFQEDPNLSAIFQLMSISYILVWMQFTQKRKFSRIVLLCVIIGALLTMSKAAMITISLCTLVLLFLSISIHYNKLTVKLFAIIIFSFVVFMLLGLNTGYLDSFLGRLEVLLFSNDPTLILTNRNIQWNAAINILLKNPLNIVIGVGLGQFIYVAEGYGLSIVSYSVHNTFVSFLTECGLFSLFLLIYILIGLLIKLLHEVLYRKSLFSLYMFFGLLAIVIFMNSLNFQNNRMAYVFLTFVFATLKRMEKGELEKF